MADRPRYPRSNCCVPGCRRTSTLFKADWLCRDHWLAVDPALRRLRPLLIRRWKRRGAWACSTMRDWRRISRALDGWWKRVKRQAIERAAGI